MWAPGHSRVRTVAALMLLGHSASLQGDGSGCRHSLLPLDPNPCPQSRGWTCRAEELGVHKGPGSLGPDYPPALLGVILLNAPTSSHPRLTPYPLPGWFQLDSFPSISTSVFPKWVSVWGLLEGKVVLCHLGPREGWLLEPSHGLALALSILCPRGATGRPGRRLVRVRGPSGQTPAGGGGLGSGGHLQPPDRDLSWAALCCSPDLTQSQCSWASIPGVSPLEVHQPPQAPPRQGPPSTPTPA